MFSLKSIFVIIMISVLLSSGIPSIHADDDSYDVQHEWESPDLSGGSNECSPTSVANNMISLTTEHGRRGDLPSDPRDIIDELKEDMSWDESGIDDRNFLPGKSAFIQRYDLPITTTIIERPSMEDLRNAIENGCAVEITLTGIRGPADNPNYQHSLTIDGIAKEGNEAAIFVSDPATPSGSDMHMISLSGGATPYILVDYPNWSGISLISKIHIQCWNSSNPNIDGNKSTTSDKNIQQNSSVIIEKTNFSNEIGCYSPPSVPSWIKQNADWWAQGLISDQDFAIGIGYMVKEKIIQIDNMELDSDGTLEISNNLEIPSWIKNNADWWSRGVISENDFKEGIEFMISEDIIQISDSQKTEIDESRQFQLINKGGTLLDDDPCQDRVFEIAFNWNLTHHYNNPFHRIIYIATAPTGETFEGYAVYDPNTGNGHTDVFEAHTYGKLDI